MKLRKLRYIPFIGGGDSKAYAAVSQDQPYGPAVFFSERRMCVTCDQADGDWPKNTCKRLQR